MVTRRKLFKGIASLIGILCLPFKPESPKTFWEGTTIPRSVSLEEARRRVNAYFPEKEMSIIEISGDWLKIKTGRDSLKMKAGRLIYG